MNLNSLLESVCSNEISTFTAVFENNEQNIEASFEDGNQEIDLDFNELQIIQIKDLEVSLRQLDIGVEITAKKGENAQTAIIKNGTPGYTPRKNIDYFDGKNGQPGKDGYTPQKTIDYWTDEDKEEIVEEVVSIIPGVDLPYATEAYANAQVSNHNVSNSAHNDLRLLIAGLSDRLNALANSDDITLDQMAEVVAYIKDNRELIEQVTTGKISVSDIVNDLTTNVTDRPLSAAQGVALKALIDAIVLPTKVSELLNDAGYLTKHQDLSDYAKLSDIPTFKTEEWTFELEDGSTVTKAVVIK